MTRSYHQFCGVARALDVVGERWTLLLVRDLLLGPLRFSDLLALEAGIGPNLLTRRLRHLEAEGVVRTRQLPPPSGAKVYELTEWGRSLEPVVLGLGRFGSVRLDAPGEADRVHLGWAFFSLQRRFVGAIRAGVVELVADRQPYAVRFTPDTLDVTRGEAPDRDARLSGGPPGFGAWLTGARSLDALVQAGALELEGDAQVARALGAAVGL